MGACRSERCSLSRCSFWCVYLGDGKFRNKCWDAGSLVEIGNICGREGEDGGSSDQGGKDENEGPIDR